MNQHTPTFPENITDYAPWVAKYGLTAPYGECQCCCGEKTKIARWTKSSKGIVKGKPYRYINGHGKIVPNAKRFWKYVTSGPFDECWIWQGGVNTSGYGIMRAGGRSEGAHRVSWEIHFGPIPDGLQCLHRCDVRNCVNPYHLFLGTHQDNMDDMVSKGRDRQLIGESHHSAKLTASQVIEIRALAAQGAPQPEIAKRFGITQSNVSQIVLYKSWKHI